MGKTAFDKIAKGLKEVMNDLEQANDKALVEKTMGILDELIKALEECSKRRGIDMAIDSLFWALLIKERLTLSD